MFSAICKFGWNNINHYILFESLDKQTALLTEAALIQKWKTYRKSAGYNSNLPKINGLDNFILPRFKRIKIYDEREYTEDERIIKRREGRKGSVVGNKSRRVRVVKIPWGGEWAPLLEVGEEFSNAIELAEILVVSPSSVYDALKKKDRYGRPRTCQGYRFEYCD